MGSPHGTQSHSAIEAPSGVLVSDHLIEKQSDLEGCRARIPERPVEIKLQVGSSRTPLTHTGPFEYPMLDLSLFAQVPEFLRSRVLLVSNLYFPATSADHFETGRRQRFRHRMNFHAMVHPTMVSQPASGTISLDLTMTPPPSGLWDTCELFGRGPPGGFPREAAPLAARRTLSSMPQATCPGIFTPSLASGQAAFPEKHTAGIATTYWPPQQYIHNPKTASELLPTGTGTDLLVVVTDTKRRKYA